MTKGTSQLQQAIVNLNKSLPSQKLMPSLRRVLVVKNSKEYTFTRPRTTAMFQQTNETRMKQSLKQKQGSQTRE